MSLITINIVIIFYFVDLLRIMETKKEVINEGLISEVAFGCLVEMCKYGNMDITDYINDFYKAENEKFNIDVYANTIIKLLEELGLIVRRGIGTIHEPTKQGLTIKNKKEFLKLIKNEEYLKEIDKLNKVWTFRNNFTSAILNYWQLILLVLSLIVNILYYFCVITWHF